MSFGGSVLAMIQSLRANARPKHSVYDSWEKAENRRFGVNKKLWSKSVSPEELNRIKTKFRKKVEAEQRRSSLVVIISVVIIIPLIIFVGFNFFFNASQRNSENYQENKEETVSVTEQINSLLNSGYEWLNKNHYKNARFQFNRVLEIQPENQSATYGLAATFVYECKIAKTNCDKAEELLTAYSSKYGEDNSIDYLKKMLND
ncbi:tetratricopeptide repeat protein [Maribellus sediminis]|uniref:tetratricopeptide repeat protein n=1 Tax=Maribellus sediminis TaxID=2696285 RepID=UPI001431F38A|nr:tetratricopeptide repeat protein [Maribellus sediminis]